MSKTYFVDTNIIVYSKDTTEPEKQPIAAQWMERLWTERSGRISTQVLNEYYVTVTRKLDPGLPSKEAWRFMEALFVWQPVVLDIPVLKKARMIEKRYSVAWWDALIVGAAIVSQCNVILSEDFQDGMKYDSVVIQNPFSA
jgi:predicted nucleic acid-binding protein